MNDNDHWTNVLFVDNPGLYIYHLEVRESIAKQEVDVVQVLLSELGYEVSSLSIVDLGSGLGRHSCILAKRGTRVLGLDISHAFINAAKNKAEQQGLKTASFQVCDMRDLIKYFPMDKEIHDGIICLCSSFGYYDDRTNEEILKSCHYLVRPDGFLVLDIMNKEWIESIALLDKETYLGEGSAYEYIRYDEHASRLSMTIIDHRGYQEKNEFRLDVQLWNINELLDLLDKTGWHLGTIALAKSLATALEPVSYKESRRIIAIMQKN